MVDVLRERGYDVRATDILSGCDFLEQSVPWVGSIVTNPPYRHADAFTARALELASEQVAMLLPIGALGGQTRYRELWSVVAPERIIVVAARMPVSGKVSQFNHIWAVWDKQFSGRTVLEWCNA